MLRSTLCPTSLIMPEEYRLVKDSVYGYVQVSELFTFWLKIHIWMMWWLWWWMYQFKPKQKWYWISHKQQLRIIHMVAPFPRPYLCIMGWENPTNLKYITCSRFGKCLCHNLCQFSTYFQIRENILWFELSDLAQQPVCTLKWDCLQDSFISLALLGNASRLFPNLIHPFGGLIAELKMM